MAFRTCSAKTRFKALPLWVVSSQTWGFLLLPEVCSCRGGPPPGSREPCSLCGLEQVRTVIVLKRNI